MKTIRRRVVVETERILLSGEQASSQWWCQACHREVTMLTVEAAVLGSGLRAVEIYHLVQVGLIHFVETDQGFLRICAESLKVRAAMDREHQIVFDESRI
ncbi:MAG TPA: hypothetical protein VFV34_02815 [Blastocatellia bacterium]|nr:hypothetical protein [Blastocatellia bacterium]